jgi:hypothetical protein
MYAISLLEYETKRIGTKRHGFTVQMGATYKSQVKREQTLSRVVWIYTPCMLAHPKV